VTVTIFLLLPYNTGMDRSRILPGAAASALLALALVLGCYQANDFDLPWHLKTGEWIAAHYAVPATDFFSFTRAGMEWLDTQWLFQLGIYGMTRALGPAGVTVFVMLGAAALLFLVAFAAPGARPGARALGGLLFLFAVNPRLLPRPEMVSFLSLAGLIFIFERARLGRPRLLWLTFPVAVVWANCEGLWPIGPFVAAVYTAEAWLADRRSPARRSLRPWLAATAAAALAGLLQPYGLRGFLFPLTLFWEVAHPASLHKQMVGEFQPLFALPLLPGLFLPLIALAVVTALAIALAGRRLRPGQLALAAVFFGLALSARRNLGLAAVALAPALITHLELAAAGRPRLDRPRPQAALSLSAISGSIALIAVCLIWPTRIWDHSFRDLGFGLSPRFYPAAAVNFLRGVGYRGRIVNDTGIGGYLIYRGWPEWQVSADSRLEIGGEQWLSGATDVFTDPEAFARMVKESGVEAVVVYHPQPYLRVFALRLANDPNWGLVFLDAKCAVFLKRNDRWRKTIAAHQVDLNEVAKKRNAGK
jgi:hypothetical protein